MQVPIRVLIAEDSEEDALLMIRELKTGGYDVKYQRVENAPALALACDLEKWDLILSDFSMPHFSGIDALKLVRSKNINVPFIFVSGTIGEETAVNAMKDGAQDYVMKGNLKRLVPAVRRGLREYEEHLERKRLERHVQQLQKFEAIGRLSGGIAHDFNNMVGAILGWAELGYEESQPGSKIRERFQKIRDQSLRTAKLTSQLLALGRQQVLEARNVNLNLLIEEEMNFLGKVLGEHIELKTRFAPDLRVTKADPTQIQQVVMNLFLNARDAMPNGGEIRIETRNVEIKEAIAAGGTQLLPGSYVLLTVADDGLGMDAATLEHLFEPFFTTKDLGKGTGLGLATVYGIVRQHGGLILVDSHPGKGATFQVYFPAQHGVHEPSTSDVGEQLLRGSETILLIEDHDGLRETVQEMLGNLGYRIIPASDGQKAVDLFKEHSGRIDLVITDVALPIQNGIDAYMEISTMRPETRVVFTSGFAPKSADMNALLEKGAKFLQKPYNLSKLSRVIRDALDRKTD